MKLALTLVLLTALAWLCEAAQPQLKTLRVTVDPYPLSEYPKGSNAVITVYKSTSLGSTWTPFKPTSVFPATRTNQFIQVVAPNKFRFYATATVQPYGESEPSSPTNEIAVSISTLSYSRLVFGGAQAAPPAKLRLPRLGIRFSAPRTQAQTSPAFVRPFSPGSRFGSYDPYSPHQFYIKP